jgi:predicted dinucleotide-binding enzyme
MKIAVFGTGMVGKTIADKIHSLGEPVTMGTRSVEKTMAADEGDHDGNPPFSAWIAEREGIRLATYLDAAAVADLVFLALPGEVVLEVLKQIGPAALAGKIIIDLTNPLDFSNGMPPTLSIVNDDSLGERVQAALPESRVVKTLNSVTASLMVSPGAWPTETTACSWPVTIPEPRRRWKRSFAGGSAGRISSTWGTSARPGAWRCTCLCGSGFGGRRAMRILISR